jgi:hypothetical protein
MFERFSEIIGFYELSIESKWMITMRNWALYESEATSLKAVHTLRHVSQLGLSIDR